MGLGSSRSQPPDPVICHYGAAREDFPLSVTAEAGRAAASAGASPATAGTVIGHASDKLQDIGIAAFQLEIPHAQRRARSAQEIVAACVRAQDRLSFLPAVAIPVTGIAGGALGAGGDGVTPRTRWVGWEVVVLARPDATFKRLTYLRQDCLNALFPEASVVDIRLLRPTLPYSADFEGEHLKMGLVQLACILEESFLACNLDRSGSAYPYHAPEASSIAPWLLDCGLAVKEEVGCEHDAYEDGGVLVAG
mmetsp:Transcript_8303/g.14881  ORF Transcript_8303/g.14881 Transcript_8303/m.14881 type:complete len:250 (-) Transcript_8303:15-764(-)